MFCKDVSESIPMCIYTLSQIISSSSTPGQYLLLGRLWMWTFFITRFTKKLSHQRYFRKIRITKPFRSCSDCDRHSRDTGIPGRTPFFLQGPPEQVNIFRGCSRRRYRRYVWAPNEIERRRRGVDGECDVRDEEALWWREDAWMEPAGVALFVFFKVLGRRVGASAGRGMKWTSAESRVRRFVRLRGQGRMRYARRVPLIVTNNRFYPRAEALL